MLNSKAAANNRAPEFLLRELTVTAANREDSYGKKLGTEMNEVRFPYIAKKHQRR
jgi:hypothetical protein